jgi:hypothetical protein
MAENALATIQQDFPLSEDPVTIDRAYEQTLPELVALPKDQLLVVNFDIPTATCTALGTVQRVAPWRAKILAELPGFDIHCLDRLGQYARALIRAQTGYTLAQKTPSDLRQLVGTTRRRYRVLLADARALAARELIQSERLDKLNGRRRSVDKAFDLISLVNVLRDAWPSIEGKTALTLAELDSAEQQGHVLVYALAHRKRPLRDFAQVAEMRQRAFTLFSNAYGQVRRAIQYLLGDSDEADKIAPTLYPRCRKRKAKAPDAAASHANAPNHDAPVAAAPEAQTESSLVPFAPIVTVPPVPIAATEASPVEVQAHAAVKPLQKRPRRSVRRRRKARRRYLWPDFA